MDFFLISMLTIPLNFSNKSYIPNVPILKGIFAVAVIIKSYVEYYCTEKIEQQVVACTAQGKCSVVQSCGAKCIKCPPPPQ